MIKLLDSFSIKSLYESIDLVISDKATRVDIRIVDSSTGFVEQYLGWADVFNALPADIKSKFHVHFLGRANFADLLCAITLPVDNFHVSEYSFVDLSKYVPSISGTTEEAERATTHTAAIREEIYSRLSNASDLDEDELIEMCERGVTLNKEEMINYGFYGDIE